MHIHMVRQILFAQVWEWSLLNTFCWLRNPHLLCCCFFFCVVFVSFQWTEPNIIVFFLFKLYTTSTSSPFDLLPIIKSWLDPVDISGSPIHGVRVGISVFHLLSTMRQLFFHSPKLPYQQLRRIQSQATNAAILKQQPTAITINQQSTTCMAHWYPVPATSCRSKEPSTKGLHERVLDPHHSDCPQAQSHDSCNVILNQ